MGLPVPYFGQDVGDMMKECDAWYREYSKTLPTEDLAGFHAHVNQYGAVWTAILDREFLPWLFVIAGVSGNMTGVPIAQFSRVDRQAAINYARDFEDGKNFVLCNGSRWCDYVNAMQKTRKVDADVYACLIARSRSSGISFLTGNTITRHEMLSAYLCGMTAEQI